MSDGPGRTIEVEVVAIGAGVERGERDDEPTRCNVGPRVDCLYDPLLKRGILLEHAAERLHQVLHVVRILHLVGTRREVLNAGRRRLERFENGKPILVNGERFELEC